MKMSVPDDRPDHQHHQTGSEDPIGAPLKQSAHTPLQGGQEKEAP